MERAVICLIELQISGKSPSAQQAPEQAMQSKNPNLPAVQSDYLEGHPPPKGGGLKDSKSQGVRTVAMTDHSNWS